MGIERVTAINSRGEFTTPSVNARLDERIKRHIAGEAVMPQAIRGWEGYYLHADPSGYTLVHRNPVRFVWGNEAPDTVNIDPSISTSALTYFIDLSMLPTYGLSPDGEVTSYESPGQSVYVAVDQVWSPTEENTFFDGTKILSATIDDDNVLVELSGYIPDAQSSETPGSVRDAGRNAYSVPVPMAYADSTLVLGLSGPGVPSNSGDTGGLIVGNEPQGSTYSSTTSSIYQATKTSLGWVASDVRPMFGSGTWYKSGPIDSPSIPTSAYVSLDGFASDSKLVQVTTAQIRNQPIFTATGSSYGLQSSIYLGLQIDRSELSGKVVSIALEAPKYAGLDEETTTLWGDTKVSVGFAGESDSVETLVAIFPKSSAPALPFSSNLVINNLQMPVYSGSAAYPETIEIIRDGGIPLPLYKYEELV